jgi:type IV pilus assembly protein PilB
MNTDNQSLYQYILDLGVVDSTKLQDALTTANLKKLDFADVLYDRDLLTDSQIGQALSAIYNLPFISLQQLTISPEIISLVPEIYCQRQQLIPFKKDRQGLHLALVDPHNIQAIEFVAKKTGLPIRAYLVTRRDFQNYFESQSVRTTDFSKSIEQFLLQASSHQDNKTPIISLVNSIVDFAYRNRASDIHIEPRDEDSLVRFRVDSVLHDITSFPREVHDQVITRIKVMSQLKIDEHSSAQDGKFQFDTESEKIDIRVSITPIVQGEKVVMRLLSSKSRQFSLTNLGLSDQDLAKLTQAYQKPFGMILSTGPTGSGKTTTLYSILKLLNNRDVNIMTIEDPVEYEMEGVNQIQVNPQTNLTFSDGLRSIVRQDPNIILVGEIRDEETAGIAANAAMTGHLVLSTIHTNNAATTIPRLYDMNIEPFIIASSVNCIIGQRLVRQICQKCRTSLELTRQQLIDFGMDELSINQLLQDKDSVRVYQGAGCTVCHNTGYSGRIGIFELMMIAGQVREAITKKSNSQEIQELAIKEGMTTMQSDGLAKVLSGQTTIEEILRVTKI